MAGHTDGTGVSFSFTLNSRVKCNRGTELQQVLAKGWDQRASCVRANGGKTTELAYTSPRHQCMMHGGIQQGSQKAEAEGQQESEEAAE